ncbi:MAG: ATP-binding protein [Thermoleophilia bacterium]|nr:ATP-binding protein [Thermoleophilia bacterium]
MMTFARQDCNWVIKVRPETAQLAQVRHFVEQVACEAELEVEKVFDLKVAVSEATANAMEHACGEEALLEIGARLEAERLTFFVTDNGFFRPPCPPRGKLTNRGLGLPLMVALMDEVSFSRTPGGGTRVSLSILLD